LGAAAALSEATAAKAQAPAKVTLDGAEERQKRLAAALGALNEHGALGVSAEDFARAEAYATAALLEAAARLRPLVLADRLDLPVTFSARRKA
jgi:hypothetical protein